MDIAYDHVQEDSFSPAEEKRPATTTTSQSTSDESTQPQPPQSPNLQSELSSAWKQASSSQWGTTLNSWFSTARKQGETFYADLTQEATEAQDQATKGLNQLRKQVAQRTRGWSTGAEDANARPPLGLVPGEEALPMPASGQSESAVAEAEALQSQSQEDGEKVETDMVKEAGTLVASLRNTAASKLKDLQKAEDAADEALLKFGTNIRNFLRDAVTISSPADDAEWEKKEGEGKGEVLFETQEPGTGKKVFHPTRLDAQLHAIHITASSFTEDSTSSDEWESWIKDFDIDAKTDDIARDLERYEELRRAMEKLVPEKVEYRAFWTRYYFLRKAVEEEERRRREVLKGAANDTEEEVTWGASGDEDEDEDDANATPSTPNVTENNQAASSSTTTLTQPAPAPELLKPHSSRNSHEDESRSVADSDVSYDIVSGATSRAMGSPKEDKEKREAGKGEEESDDDWE